MKKTLLTLALALLSAATLLAQAPQGFTYQAAVRDAQGQAVAQQTVSVRVSLIQGSTLGVERYAELHHPTTDAAGLFTLVVGQGTALVNCTMEDCVDWADGPWFLRTQVDPAGGESFTLGTTQQLMSVPYALYAANAGGTAVRDSVVVHIRDSVVVHIHDSVVVHLRDSVVVHLRDSVVYDTVDTYSYDSHPADITGALPGVFSISPANRIAFSKGNLQYKASTNTFRFAEHQWDMVGTANSNISQTDTLWIDLFGYGTSGYNGKMPYASSGSYSDYRSGYDINATPYDWGVYNVIQGGGDTAGRWRTLTKEEWRYILFTRPNASTRRAVATVCGIPGMLLLPDSWTAVPGALINTNATSYSVNNYTTAQWNLLQDAGAVFLPAAGRREVTEVINSGSVGNYWTSTSKETGYSYYIYFPDPGSTYSYITYGRSVRLVCDLTVMP